MSAWTNGSDVPRTPIPPTLETSMSWWWWWWGGGGVGGVGGGSEARADGFIFGMKTIKTNLSNDGEIIRGDIRRARTRSEIHSRPCAQI